MIKVFIGYDPREAAVFHTCVNSIITNASQPVSIIPLCLSALGDYTEVHDDGSNEFIYSRFLVPHLMGHEGWAIYIDGDMLLRHDIADLWNMKREDKALMCVHHEYKSRVKTKYLGSKNEDYPRKNWSSVILWNCGHEANRVVDSKFVQEATGAQLHRFTWLEDNQIGGLPIEWNWLPDELGENENASLLHWTLGAPCFHEYADAPMAALWHRENMLANFCIQKTWKGPFSKGYD